MKDQTKSNGRAAGGLARSKALSQNERKAIAQKAAAARWGKPIRAIHKGNFLDEFGADVECYVLDDATRTAVISQTGMGRAIGLSSRGSALPRFVKSQSVSPFLGADLLEKLENPLKFQYLPPGAGTPPFEGLGYDATILVDLCKAVIKADAELKLKPHQRHVARQAAMVVSASAKSGIKGLVYALSGYNPTADEVIQAFKLYVSEEAREYEKEFPDQLYDQWYRLYQLPDQGGNTRPWRFAHLTVNQVYMPLARSNGKIYELTQAQKAKSAARHKKLHQFLSEVGVKALRTHLGQLLGIAQISKSKEEYERHVEAVFGNQMQLNLEEHD